MLHNQSIVEKLEGANLTTAEWLCLYPPKGMLGKSADFGISLLVKLISAICHLTPPATGWVARPTYADHSLVADLVRIKFYRNLLGRSEQGMTYNEFVSLSEEISDSLLRIAANIGPEKRTEWQKLIHKLVNDPLIVHEEKNAEEMLQWYENDTEGIKEFMPLPATTTELCSFETILRELGQRLRDLIWKDLLAKTRGVQGEQRSSSKVVEEGTTDIASTAAKEKCQAEDQQGEADQPTGQLSFSVGGLRGGRASLKKVNPVFLHVLTFLLVCHNCILFIFHNEVQKDCISWIKKTKTDEKTAAEAFNDLFGQFKLKIVVIVSRNNK